MLLAARHLSLPIDIAGAFLVMVGQRPARFVLAIRAGVLFALTLARESSRPRAAEAFETDFLRAGVAPAGFVVAIASFPVR